MIKIIGVVDLEKWRTSSKAHICCNYNYKYDNKDKTIIKSKEEFYYFLNENNEAIITKGKEEYNFTNQDIVIPSVIDNHIVKAIGMNAFENCTFKSMIISDDIKIISFHAFNKTKFIVLKFPRNLDYFDDNVFEESVYVSRYEVDSNKYRDGFIILMPYKINNIDIFKNKKIYVSNEEKNHQLNLLWEEKPTYNYDHLNICNGQVIYNCDLEMVYILKKDKEKYISIVYFCNFINGIPKVINDIKIFGWDNHFINQILDWRYDKPKLIEPLKIPSEIKYIYSLFNDKIYIHDDYYHLIELPRQLIVIENVISDRITIFLSKHIKIIRNCSCTFLIEENANFEGIDCNSKFLTNCSQVKNNGVFEYVIIEQKYVYIFNCVSESKIIELPSKIDDKLVLYCILFLEKNIDEFIINNIYVDENYLNFSIASDSYIKKVSIGKDIKTIKTLSNIFGCINFEFCQVKKNFYFQIYDGVEIINDTYFDEKIFDLKNTNIILPDSLKYVGKNSLICFNILHVEANKLTKFSPHSIYPNCVITFRKNKINKMHDYGNLDNKLSFEEDETNN